MRFSSRLPRNLQPSDFSRLQSDLAASGDLCDLTQSNPTLAGFAIDPLAGLDLLAAGQGYHPSPRGDLAARQAIADYYRNNGHGEIDPEDLLLTASTSEAYAFLLKLLTEPGDEILVPAPSYPLFDFLAAMEKVHVERYPLRPDPGGGWSIDFALLEERISPVTRAIVVVNPNNPTGSYLGEREAATLAGICTEQRLALLVDEVFLDYRNPRHADAARSAVGERATPTFVMSGFSKILALPQVKLGWIHSAGPAPFKEEARQRLDFIADTYLSVNAMVQRAAPALLARQRPVQEEILTRIVANEATLAALGVTAMDRQGGWYAVLPLPPELGDERCCQQLLAEQRVLVHPGYFYDFPESDRLVVSLITPPEQFAHGIACLADFLRQG
jgi:aspartate/methionine/tyrosine aminotransferase